MANPTQSDMAQRFIDSLRRFEQTGDIDPLVALFSDGCALSNVVGNREFHGKDGVRAFWSVYRATLGQVQSEFRNIIASGDRIALEWETRGTSPSGEPLDYKGVSILELDGGAISRFCAYFNPSNLPRSVAHPTHAPSAGAGGEAPAIH